MSTRRKRGARVSGANEPKQLIRAHAHCLRSERRAVETFARAAWDSPDAGSVMLGDREAAAIAGSAETCHARNDVLDRTARLCDRLAASVLNHILALEECLSAGTVALYAPMCVSSSELAPAVVVNSGATAWAWRLVEVDAGRGWAIIYR